MVIESFWIFVWKSLKVLEFDFLKQCVWTSDFQCNILLQLKIFTALRAGIRPSPLSVCFCVSDLVTVSDDSSFSLILESVKLSNVNWTCLDLLIKVLFSFNVVLLKYPSSQIVWSLKGLEKFLNLILTFRQELCLRNVWKPFLVSTAVYINDYLTMICLLPAGGAGLGGQRCQQLSEILRYRHATWVELECGSRWGEILVEQARQRRRILLELHRGYSSLFSSLPPELLLSLFNVSRRCAVFFWRASHTLRSCAIFHDTDSCRFWVHVYSAAICLLGARWTLQFLKNNVMFVLSQIK